MDPTSPPEFKPDAQSDSSLAGNLALLNDLAQSFRRLKGGEKVDDKGLRTIWHQGRLRTELFSWQTTKGEIVKQELSLFGLVVEYRQGKPLRTGQIPLEEGQTGVGHPTSAIVRMDTALSERTLSYASHLLKHVPDRDCYTQHLLMHINQALNALSSDSQTTVSAPTIDSRAKLDARDSETRITTTPLRRRSILSYVVLTVAALLLVLVGILLRRALH